MPMRMRGAPRILSEEHREDTTRILEGLQAEIEGEFRAWREERGIPDL
jgi:hypothetical protein